MFTLKHVVRWYKSIVMCMRQKYLRYKNLYAWQCRKVRPIKCVQFHPLVEKNHGYFGGLSSFQSFHENIFWHIFDLEFYCVQSFLHYPIKYRITCIFTSLNSKMGIYTHHFDDSSPISNGSENYPVWKQTKILYE